MATTATASARRPAPISSSTRTTRCTGRPGARGARRREGRADKPILLSIGYAACHWCHVMAHESFENPQIAGADERALRQHQGRPRGAARSRRDLPERAGADGRAGRLAADDVPDARTASRSGAAPISRRSRAGAGPGFRAGAGRDQRRPIRQDRDKVAKNVAALREALQRLGRPRARRGGRAANCSTASPSGCCARSTSCTAASAARRNSRRRGDLRIAVARLEAHPPRRPIARPSRTALDAMCQGGIYDHLGGGFARYSTDARWLVPHFEKMLYDNAELVEPADAGLAGDPRPALRRSASPRRSAGSSAR